MITVFYIQCITAVFFSWHSSPARARAASFLWLNRTQWHIIARRTPLNEGWARSRDLYLKTQYSEETDIHVAGGIRICNPSKRSGADLRLRPLGQWVRHKNSCNKSNLKNVQICFKFLSMCEMFALFLAGLKFVPIIFYECWILLETLYNISQGINVMKPPSSKSTVAHIYRRSGFDKDTTFVLCAKRLFNW
jgi:hypothetical protein